MSPVVILSLRKRVLHIPTCSSLRRTRDRSHGKRVLHGYTAEGIARGELRPPVRFHSCTTGLMREIETGRPAPERNRYAAKAMTGLWWEIASERHLQKRRDRDMTKVVWERAIRGASA